MADSLFAHSTRATIAAAARNDDELLRQSIFGDYVCGDRHWILRGQAANDEEIVVDLFAGGGGATEGIERAIGRPVDLAFNHDHNALILHSVNHPETEHYIEDVFATDPVKVCRGRRVGLLWASPTCTHFSRARSGTPLNYHEARRIRGLAWIVVRWAAAVRPRVIHCENVPEFLGWGRLGKDGVADKARKGEYFRKWVRRLESMGYRVEHRIICAADFGSPTIRERVFITARCDGDEIVWPQKTHGPERAKAHVPAAAIVNWSLEGKTIFGRKKGLAKNSLKRIAAVVVRHILKSENPFVVPRHGEGGLRLPSISIHRGGRTGARVDQPMHTITSGAGSKRAAGAAHALGVVEADAIELAAMAQHNLGVIGRPVTQPMSTLLKKCSQQQLVTATLTSFYSSNTGSGGDLRQPMGTVLAGGFHHGVTETSASNDAVPTPGALRVAAFLKRYYVAGKREPAPSIDVLNGVLSFKGRRYQIQDIRCRMVEPRECFSAQGFSSDYIIDPVCIYKTRSGKFKHGRLPKHEQIAKCGNSVCPQVAEALVRANYAKPQLEWAIAA